MKMLIRALTLIFVYSMVGLQSSFAQSDSEGTNALIDIKSDFDLLKLLGFVAIVLSVALGLALFAYRHKRLMQYDSLMGLVTAVIIAPILLFSFTSVVLSTNSAACLTMSVSSGAEAQPLDTACGSSRESAANMIGATSLWHSVTGGDGVIAPLSAGIVKFLMYLSVLLGALILYLLLRPILKRFI